MRTIKMSLIVICISFLVINCASFPKADSEHNTMVIGVIIQEGKGYKIYGTTSVNGTNKFGIEITLMELVDGKTYTMRTRNDGLFYSVNIPEGVYKILKVYLKKESGSSWASITWSTPDDVEHRIEIISGKVNNIGTIKWDCEKEVKNIINYNREYGQAKDIFQEKYKSSNWNEKEWIDINIKK